jgi:hypothetical protein
MNLFKSQTAQEITYIRRIFKKLEYFIAIKKIKTQKEAFEFLRECYLEVYYDTFDSTLDENIYLNEIFSNSKIESIFNKVDRLSDEERKEFISSLNRNYYNSIQP